MVQRMIDAKLKEYGLANTGTGVPTCDKQLISGKKIALRDLQNEPRNMAPKLPGSSPLSKGGKPIVDNPKVIGIKRSRSDCPTGPTSQQSMCNNGTNGRLVYVRRKVELESDKLNSSNIENANSPQSRKSSDGKQEPHMRHNQMPEPTKTFAPMPAASIMNPCGEPSVPNSQVKPANGLTVSEQNYRMLSTGTPIPVNPMRTCSQYWEERLLRLKMFLKNCAQSSYEEYIQKLHSLSAAERSRHAVELEKRTIRLSLEEVKEMHRMQVLNVLGNSALKSNVTPLTQARFQALSSLKQEEQIH
ncbi:uncharacterized protein LOC143886665 [Tasmannia lanceolata]|uniref:uncharacterized protein LOC143886665 n=1 Tax=Tasmannia lanceolata TaxID=3420 RepID=UPI004062C90A